MIKLSARCLVRACTALVLAASVAPAQTTYEENGASIRFEVYDPGTQAWTSGISAFAGQQVEFRAVVSYTGTRTDLYSFGAALYQPIVTNADNTGAGAQADQLGAFRNGGNQGLAQMLTRAEGEDGNALADYGRVVWFGSETTATGSTTLTSFRHSDPGDPWPNGGEFIRMAGSGVSVWPTPLPGPCTSTEINRILRGVSSGGSPIDGIHGTTDLVVFRQALRLSDNAASRAVSISTFVESFRRVGGTTSSDDRRYFEWRTGPADSGSHRTSVTIVPATIWVNVPAPGGAAASVMAVLWASRRRR